MKDIVVEQVEDKSFKPLKISFVIETEEELADLFCRFNLADTTVINKVREVFARFEKPREEVIDRMRNKSNKILDILDDYIEANLPNFFQEK